MNSIVHVLLLIYLEAKVKGILPFSSPLTIRRGVEVELYSVLTLAIDGGKLLSSCPG